MTTAVIVQARRGSSRLPGKVLLDLGGRSVLSHVLSRCARIDGADVVVCAAPEGAEDDAVAEEAARCGAVVFRGSETDVLARYHGAARSVSASVVMRVTSDCPFIDPEVCAAVLARRAMGDVDYATNNTPPTWPHGLDCEAFTMAALEQAAASATSPEEREHVTPWLRSRDEIRRANVSCPVSDVSARRWTLDHPEDLEFFRAAVAALPDPARAPTLSWRDWLAHSVRFPELERINANCKSR